MSRATKFNVYEVKVRQDNSQDGWLADYIKAALDKGPWQINSVGPGLWDDGENRGVESVTFVRAESFDAPVVVNITVPEGVEVNITRKGK